MYSVLLPKKIFFLYADVTHTYVRIANVELMEVGSKERIL